MHGFADKTAKQAPWNEVFQYPVRDSSAIVNFRVFRKYLTFTNKPDFQDNDSRISTYTG